MFNSKKFKDLKTICSLSIVILIAAWFVFSLPGRADVALAAPPVSPTVTRTPSPTALLTPGPGVTLSFSPVDDARIKFSNPTSNYGSDNTLNVDGSIGDEESFLAKFFVQNTGGYPIARATLYLYNMNESDAGGDFYFIADNSWSEETLTWNNAPTAGTVPIDSIGTVTINNWYEVDLTSLIAGEGVYSLRVSSTDSNGADYSSKEGSNPPQLKIVLANGPTATPGPSPTPIITYTPSATSPATSTFTPRPTATPKPGGYYSFAVIGDYGEGNQGEADVAAMIKSWNVDFIVTVGDNNYPDGAAGTIDENIGQHYHEYIYPYGGSFGPGAETNRFFPSLGNHDLHENGGSGEPYYNYFTLPGNERYYDIVQGPLHFFILNSDSSEPDGVGIGSIQITWLINKLAASTSPWDIVVLHKSPYSSCSYHGSSATWQYPYKEWGADVVMAGHNHVYERLSVNGMPYFVNGLGGGSIYSFADPLPDTQARFTGDYGAMLVEGDASQLVFKFITRSNLLVDTFTLTSSVTPSPLPSNTPEPSPTTVLTATDTPEPSPTTIPTATDTPEPSPTTVPTATATPEPSPTMVLTATDTLEPSPTTVPTGTETPEPSPTTIPTGTETPEPSPTMIPTATDTPEPSPTTIPDLIFKDGFESGNLPNWSASTTDAGDLSSTSTAALVEQSGLLALIDDKRAIYVSDTSPNAESHYRVRFYLDPNSLKMSSTPLVIFYGYTGSSTQVLRVELCYSASGFQSRAGMRTDGSAWTYIPWTNISDASHIIELDWQAATAAGANNGRLTFWIDERQAGAVTGIDNDRRRIDLVNLGVLAGIETSTRGTLYFDAFESRRQSYIGPVLP